MMFCEHYRLNISESLDSGNELNAGTLKHIAKCKDCRQYYDDIKKLDSSLICEPDPIPGYDFDRLNQAISDKIESAEPVDTESLHYPTVKYNHKFALAATFIIAATLAFSIFVNSAINSNKNTPELAGNNGKGGIVDNSTNNADRTGAASNRNIAASPHMALIYQISSFSVNNLDKQEVKSTFIESKEIYEKTQEISEKSYDVINTAMKNSHLITVLF